jgi:aspartyl-tRNA(Asn)/glutamyl-tRNA(Gln) amidotransferase subunit A
MPTNLPPLSPPRMHKLISETIAALSARLANAGAAGENNLGISAVSNAGVSAGNSAGTATSRRALVDRCLEGAAASTAIFTRLYPEAARLAADQADAMQHAGIGAPSPLAGLPVSIKDLLDVAGEPTLAGSVVCRDAAPAERDAPVVARLRAAGAAILGKTNMTEFAYSGVGLNPHYGTPANPADATVARIPGGSSSGAAVSVAAGFCVAAIGSDTGGSIRIPAALCGLVGFKPTARRVPTAGAIPLSTTLDTICAMTRSVDDCILVDGIIADSALLVPTLPLAGLRLAVPQTLMLDDMDAHVATTFAATLRRLSAAGASIIDCPLPALAEYLAFGYFSSAEAYAWHRHLLARREDGYDVRVSKRILQGASISAADYIDLHAARNAWIVRMEAVLAPFDALIMPTVPIVAPPIAELEASHAVFFKYNSLLLRNTAAFNLLDGCAVSLPCHAPGTLPVGLMVAGPAMADARVLGVSRAIELALNTIPIA